MVVDNRLKDICVSLSGGVDSMLVLAIMIILKDLKSYRFSYCFSYQLWE